MGMLIDGVWHPEDQPTARSDGRWERSASLLRNWITADGSPGPTGQGGFKAEAGRYHLYVAWNCPWAHRTLLMRQAKELVDIIDVSVAAPRRTDQGWVFDDASGYLDQLFGSSSLHEVYSRSRPGGYTGRSTVPVLWDTQTKTIVSNESADIVRMCNDAFVGIAPETADLYPVELRVEIDAWNERIYNTVNNGVYRAGFSTTQAAYEEVVVQVFETLDAIEQQLEKRRYLLGDRLTETDWRLFPTLVRFDVAYFGAFKCNIRRVIDYPNLWAYTRELYQMPGIADTVKPDIYKQGYYSPSKLRNPLGIVPVGPQIDFWEPHGRG